MFTLKVVEFDKAIPVSKDLMVKVLKRIDSKGKETMACYGRDVTLKTRSSRGTEERRQYDPSYLYFF